MNQLEHELLGSDLTKVCHSASSIAPQEDKPLAKQILISNGLKAAENSNAADCESHDLMDESEQYENNAAADSSDSQKDAIESNAKTEQLVAEVTENLGFELLVQGDASQHDQVSSVIVNDEESMEEKKLMAAEDEVININEEEAKCKEVIANGEEVEKIREQLKELEENHEDFVRNVEVNGKREMGEGGGSVPVGAESADCMDGMVESARTEQEVTYTNVPGEQAEILLDDVKQIEDMENIADPHNNTISELHGDTIFVPHEIAVSEPHEQVISEPCGEEITEPHEDAVSEPHEQVISEPCGEEITEPHEQAVSEPHEQAISEPHEDTVSEFDEQANSEPHQDATSGKSLEKPVEPSVSNEEQMEIEKDDGNEVNETKSLENEGNLTFKEKEKKTEMMQIDLPQGEAADIDSLAEEKKVKDEENMDTATEDSPPHNADGSVMEFEEERPKEEISTDLIRGILDKCVDEAYLSSPSTICAGIIDSLIQRTVRKVSQSKKRKSSVPKMVLELGGSSLAPSYEQNPVSVDSVLLQSLESLAGMSAPELVSLLEKNISAESRGDVCLALIANQNGISMKCTQLASKLQLPIGKSRNMRLECLLCGSRFDVHSECQRHLMQAHNLCLDVIFLCEPCEHESLDAASFVQHLTDMKHLKKLGLPVECIEIMDESEAQHEDAELIAADLVSELVEESVDSSPSELVASILNDVVEQSIEESPSEVCRSVLNSIVEEAITLSPSDICSTILSEILDAVVPEEEEEETSSDPFASPSHIQIAVLANVVCTTKQQAQMSPSQLQRSLLSVLESEKIPGNVLTFTATNAGITLGRSMGQPDEHHLPVEVKPPSCPVCKLCGTRLPSDGDALKHFIQIHHHVPDVFYKCEACAFDCLNMKGFLHHIRLASHRRHVAQPRHSAMMWDVEENSCDQAELLRHRVRPSVVRLVRLENVRAKEHMQDMERPMAAFSHRFICLPCRSCFQRESQLRTHFLHPAHREQVSQRPELRFRCPVCQVTLCDKRSLLLHYNSKAHKMVFLKQRPKINRPETDSPAKPTPQPSKANKPSLSPTEKKFQMKIKLSDKSSDHKPKHELPVTLVKRFFCEACSKTFNNIIRMKLHYMSVPHREQFAKRYGSKGSMDCKVCRLSFPLKSFISHQYSRAHLENLSREGKPSLKPKAIGSLTLQEEATGSQKKPKSQRYSCLRCNKTYLRQSHLERHYRSKKHIENSAPQLKKERKRDNPPALPKPASAAPDVAKRAPLLARPPVNKKHYCDVCNRYFISSPGLRKHVMFSTLHKSHQKKNVPVKVAKVSKVGQSHHEKNFKCALCNVSFKTLPALLSHKRTSTSHRTNEAKSKKPVTKEVYVALKDISPKHAKSKKETTHSKLLPGKHYKYCDSCDIQFGHYVDFVDHQKSELHKRRLGSKRGRSPSPDVTVVEQDDDLQVVQPVAKRLRDISPTPVKATRKAAASPAVAKKPVKAASPVRTPVQPVNEKPDPKDSPYWCGPCGRDLRYPSTFSVHKESVRHRETVAAAQDVQPVEKGEVEIVSPKPAKKSSKKRKKGKKGKSNVQPQKPDFKVESFACSICSLTFGSSQEQNAHFLSQQHVQELLKKTMPYCEPCKMAFGTPFELEQHKGTSEHKGQLQAMTPAAPDMLQPKPKRGSAPPPPSPPTQEETLKSVSRVKKGRSRMKKEPVDEPASPAAATAAPGALECKVCVMTFKYRVGYFNHLKSAGHRQKQEAEEMTEQLIPFECSICNLTFPVRSQYLEHMKSKAHSKKKAKHDEPLIDVEAPQSSEWMCTVCDRSFTARLTYFNHIKSSFHQQKERDTKASQKSWECQACDRSFRVHFAYFNHLKSQSHIDRQKMLAEPEIAAMEVTAPSSGRKRRGAALPEPPKKPHWKEEDVLVVDSEEESHSQAKQDAAAFVETDPTASHVLDGLVGVLPDYAIEDSSTKKSGKGKRKGNSKASKKRPPAQQTINVGDKCFPVAMYPGLWAPVASRSSEPSAAEPSSTVPSSQRQSLINSTFALTSSMTSTTSAPASSAVVSSSTAANASAKSSAAAAASDSSKNVLYGCPSCTQKFKTVALYKSHYKIIHCSK